MSQTLNREFGAVITRLIQKGNLTRKESELAFISLLNNEVTEMQQGAFLAALTAKGETRQEVAGAILAAASKKTAIVLDGVISTAAGLVAYLIHPAVQGYFISGHRSVEKAQKAALGHMNLAPLIDFDMRLGEGTGAALAMDIIDASCKILCEMASFDEAKVARSSMYHASRP